MVISKKSKNGVIKDSYDLDTIAGRVRWKREKLGFKSNELAEMCNVPATSINMLEMGKVQQPRYLTTLAEKLKTSTDYLLYGDSDENTIRISKDTTLISVDQDIRPDFSQFDYYVVKIKKGKEPFYPSSMNQVGQVEEIFIGHKDTK
jgi:transcriptional regulator with XRE-family HTH domain